MRHLVLLLLACAPLVLILQQRLGPVTLKLYMALSFYLRGMCIYLISIHPSIVSVCQVRTGGKGTVRRKKKAVHKTATTDDKRLQVPLRCYPAA